jgi:hypothetical protein
MRRACFVGSLIGSTIWVIVLAATVVPAGATLAVKKPNACKVVKASEVSQVTGFTATKSPTQQQGPPGASICGYTLADTSVRNVSVFVQPGVGVAEYKTAKRQLTSSSASPVESVTGFGKRSFYAGGGLNALYVLDGDTLFYVQYVAFGTDDPATIRANIEAMTRIGLARI